MTAGALGEERPTLFLRKATGLVRGWSVRDSLIYACLATNFVTLGIYEFTFAGPAFPKGQFITATIIGGIWVTFLVIAYSGLVVTIPRAGGDYVWQTRILSSGIGFVMAATGWWFILWLWAPIYGNILAVQLFQPIWATLKWTWPTGGAAWFGTHNGVFIVTLITIAVAGVLVSIGMAGYAKVQRWCFIGGLLGFAVVVILLLINVLLLVLGCLLDMAPSILICTPILLPVVVKFGVDPVHFGMIMLLNLGIGLCHPPVGSILFVGCAVGRVTIEQVVREIWPFYAVMFIVLMLVTYIPSLSLWLPRALSL